MVNVDDKIDWVQFYSGYLQRPKPAGDHKFNACCPFHQERNPSFWFNTTNGMWKCETGCGSGNATSFLARAEGIDTHEAWKRLLQLAGVEDEERPKLPETVAHYAESKHLPEAYLAQLGLQDRPESGRAPACVSIPYYDEAGTEIAIKQRYNAQNKQRFGWDKGGKPTLYGLWLDINKKAQSVILCEGESDAQSCWLHGLPCYGVPGATNFQSAWVKQYIGDRKLYIHVEPDGGGTQFLAKTLQKLKEGGYTGQVKSFRCSEVDGCKDLSEVLIRYGDDFRAKVDPVIKAAKVESLDDLPLLHEAVETGQAQKKEVQPLEVYKASELYGKKLEEPPCIVRGMVPAGLTILAGAPKKGKSWMSLAMAISVATGQPFLGMETQAGDVLYLDLESAQFRLQKRLSTLLVGPGPERLWISHNSERLDGGLLEQLQQWAESVDAPSLVIIDTFGRVDAGKKKGENAYQGDTRVLGELQKFAIQRRLGVLIVHHLRKVSGNLLEDPLERISGSMGLTGAADSVMLLDSKRGEADATLSVTSRDFNGKSLAVSMDNGHWVLKSTNSEEYLEEQEYTKSEICRAIVKIAHKCHEWRGTSLELLDELQNLGVMEATETDPRNIAQKIVKFRDKLYDREGVIFTPSKRGAKGRRVLEIKEVKTDEF